MWLYEKVILVSVFVNFQRKDQRRKLTKSLTIFYFQSDANMNQAEIKNSKVDKEKSRKSQIVHPLQSSKTSETNVTPKSAVPELPQGRTTLDLTLNLEADVAFQMFFTDSEFYRNWLFVSYHFNNMRTGCTKKTLFRRS